MFYYMFDTVNQKTQYDAIPDDPSSPAHTIMASPLNESGNGIFMNDTTTDPSSRQQRRVCIDDAIDAIGTSWSLCSVQGRLFWGTALLFTVDSMELAVLAYLSRAVDQRVEQYHDDYIQWTGVGGALVGAVVLGTAGDRLGRARVTQALSQIITVFGIVTALLCTTTITTTNNSAQDKDDDDHYVVQGLLVSRFLVGFGLGGITVPYDLLAEWLPNHINIHHGHDGSTTKSLRRGQVLLLVHVFWSVGFLLIFGLLETHTVLSPEPGKLTGIELWWCALPAILATLVLVTPRDGSSILESPRFLLAAGRKDDALRVLRCAAAANGKDPDSLFPLDDDDEIVLYSNESQLPLAPSATTTTTSTPGHTWSGICSLFSVQWLKLSSALLFTYFGQAFCYRGTADMLVSVFDEDEHQQKYQAVGSAVSEVAGIGLLLLTVDPWGRVPTQVAAYALAALSCLTLAVWYSLPFLENGNVLIAMTLIARMLVFGGGCTTWVSTTEVLSTSVRTTGHAVAAGMAGRLGAFAAGDIPETRMKEMGRSYNLLGHSERRWGSYRRR